MALTPSGFSFVGYLNSFQPTEQTTTAQSPASPESDSYGFHPNIPAAVRAQMLAGREDSMTTGKGPGIPYNIHGEDQYASTGLVFDAEEFYQAHVIDVIQNPPNASSEFLAKKVSVPLIVKALEPLVVALSYGKGSLLGTGLLIHPRLVLTARHCLENLRLADVSIRVGCQKSHIGIMNFGEPVSIEGVVEENSALDYAILYLGKTVKRAFDAIHFETSQDQENIREGCLLFHHPNGGPKKVSLMPTARSQYQTLRLNTANDSEPGSSGGIFVAPNEKIVALHQMKFQEATDATFINHIWKKSKILRTFYPQGKFKSSLFGEVFPSLSSLEPTANSIAYQKWLEVITAKPSNYPPANAGNTTGIDLAYHHIIPKSNMEFMWMLGKEYPLINQALAALLNHPNPAQLSVKQVVWLRGNLFTGPSSRFTKKELAAVKSVETNSVTWGYDPESGIEPTKPLSFDQQHWNNLMNLNSRIETCWQERCKISNLTQPQTIAEIDHAVKSGNWNMLIVSPLIKPYHDALHGLYSTLMTILPRDIHPYASGDWQSYPGQSKWELKV